MNKIYIIKIVSSLNDTFFYHNDFYFSEEEAKNSFPYILDIYPGIPTVEEYVRNTTFSKSS